MSPHAICYFQDCPNEARRRGLCWGHAKQRSRRNGRLVELQEKRGSEYDSPFGRLMEAVFTVSELKATDHQGWERARDRVRKAAVAYAQSLGYRRVEQVEKS